MAYPHLFSPLQINALTLRNRIILPSMVTNFAANNGEVTDRLIHYHAERAKGGCALNMLEATYVGLNGHSYLRGVGADSDAMVPGLRRLCNAIHAHDGKAGIQLMHGGRTALPATSRHPILLVSFIPGLTNFAESRVMDEEDIAAIIQDFAMAARRSKEAGFDLIELHGAHGYLIQQFMSPLTNIRQDKYGGSFENRMRFPLEVLASVRKEVGTNYPIMFRFSTEEFLPGGIQLELAKDIAKCMVDGGVDALHVSVGLGETNHFTIPPSCIEQGWNADRSQSIKEAVKAKVPVAVVGRIKNAFVAEKLLSEGKADLVAMGRALIADPCLPIKAERGLDADVLPCVACNEGCVGLLGQGQAIGCAVNPRVGREALHALVQSNSPLTVVVIGGGPAGMQAALAAAQRGHAVSLYEKASSLGGLVNLAALPPHKAEYKELVQYFTRTLDKAGVKVHLNTSLDAQAIAHLKADALFVCTGSTPLRPAFCDGVNAITGEEALSGAALGNKVLILGGGLVGSECAEFLAKQGKEVTILEMRQELALDMEARSRKLFMPRLQALGVNTMLQCHVQHISPLGEVKLRDVYGCEKTLPPFDTLILALGYRPNTGLLQELSALGLSAQAIGDCRQPGKVMQAIYEGFSAAYAL